MRLLPTIALLFTGRIAISKRMLMPVFRFACAAGLVCLAARVDAQSGRELIEASLRRHAPPPYVYEEQALVLSDMDGKWDMHITVSGGGSAGQAAAIRLGVSRALLIYNEQLKGLLRGAGLLTRDPRMKERKKPGQKAARRRFQYSKR